MWRDKWEAFPYSKKWYPIQVHHMSRTHPPQALRQLGNGHRLKLKGGGYTVGGRGPSRSAATASPSSSAIGVLTVTKWWFSASASACTSSGPSSPASADGVRPAVASLKFRQKSRRLPEANHRTGTLAWRWCEPAIDGASEARVVDNGFRCPEAVTPNRSKIQEKV